MDTYFLNPNAGNGEETLKGDGSCEDGYFAGNDELAKRYSDCH